MFLAGCAKKPLSQSQLHEITDEIVTSAQRITDHNAKVTVKRGIQRPGGSESDEIEITLRNSSEEAQFEKTLNTIARRHKLSFAEGANEGGDETRIDLASRKTITHSIYLRSSPAPAVSLPHQAGTAKGYLAIIFDDLGHDQSSADSILDLPFPVTISVLPNLLFSAAVANEANRRGDEVILHLPMEALSEGDGAEGAIPEPLELHPGMTKGQIAAAVNEMLETVPHAVGVNNHQGSLATCDPELMQELMPLLRQRNLFFIDSRTTAATVAYKIAEQTGVHAASRKVFLDDVPTREAVLRQLELAAHDALKDGSAIAIGHPHPATIAALAEGVPRLSDRGIGIVFASDLVH